MTDTNLTASLEQLEVRFPGAVSADTRPGYSGYIISPERLAALARSLRDDPGYDYLSSGTAVG